MVFELVLNCSDSRPLMARNIEIKARVSDLPAVRSRVAAITASAPEVLMQSDTFYAAPTGRLKLRRIGDSLAELIYYERPNQAGPRASAYVRTPIPDPASMHELLHRALGTKAIVRKRRELYVIGQTRVHLDEVEGLGAFLELEVVLSADDKDQDGERISNTLIGQLGIRPEDLIKEAYVDLLNVVRLQG
jgi:predicted adenylyl cyclase CyaB